MATAYQNAVRLADADRLRKNAQDQTNGTVNGQQANLGNLIRAGATQAEVQAFNDSGVVPQSFYDRNGQSGPMYVSLYGYDKVPGSSYENWKISDQNKDFYHQVQRLYQSGDVTGAINLMNEKRGKENDFTGYYDDQGNYWGWVRGEGGASGNSFQPVLGGQLMATGKSDTNTWLTPDGRVLNGSIGGSGLANNGLTWTNQHTAPRGYNTWGERMDEYGLTPGHVMDAKAENGDYLNPALNTAAGNDWAAWKSTQTPIDGTLPGYTPAGSGLLPEEYRNRYAGSGGGEAYGPEAALRQTAPTQYSGGESPRWTGETYDPEQDTLWQAYLAQYGGGEGPRWTGETYDPEQDSLWQAYLAQYGGAEAPGWAGSPYTARRDEALAGAAAPFSYDPETDPVYGAYRKAYTREGRRAAEDTLGRYAALTGGLPGTAAVTAASQAGNNYAAKLADKLPELYQQAYERYLEEYRRQLGLAEAYDAYAREDRDRYLEDLAQWNGDRSFAYGAARDSQAAGRQRNETEYARYLDDLARWSADRSFAYGAARDSQAAGRQRNEAEYARYLDDLARWNGDRSFAYGAARDSQAAGRQRNEAEYARYLDRLDQYNKDRSFAYTRERDADNDARLDREWAQKLREYADAQNWKAEEWAQYLREYGDKLNQQERDYVYKLSQAEEDKRRWDMDFQYGQYRDSIGDAQWDAQFARQQNRDLVSDAQYTDSTNYQRALDAWDMGNTDYDRLRKDAEWRAQYGDYSGLRELGIDVDSWLASRQPASTGYSGSRYTGSGGGDTTEDYAISTVNAAYKAYLNGDRSELTLRILRSAGLEADERLTDGSIPGKPAEGEYAVMDRVLADMQAQGRPWSQLQTELDAELRDGRITREEYEALREKYVSRGLNDGVRNLEGAVHRDGSPMSAGFAGVWRTVRDLADREEREKALTVMRRAYEAGTIHEYEIDVMMDQLGW